MPARDDGFGRFLEGYIAAHGVTRDELCARADVDQSTLSREFSGVRDIPPRKIVRYVHAAATIAFERKRRQIA